MASVGVVGLDTEAVTGVDRRPGDRLFRAVVLRSNRLGAVESHVPGFAIRTAIAGCYDAHRWGICWPRLTTWRVRLES